MSSKEFIAILPEKRGKIKLKSNTCYSIQVAQLGARMHYAVPRIFHQAGMLERFYTDIYLGNKPIVSKIFSNLQLKFRNLDKLIGRNAGSILPEKVFSFDFLGLQYWWRQKRAKDIQELHHVFAWGGKEFCKRIIESEIGKPDIIYGFQSASLELFKYAKEKGIKCILEQTITPQKIQRKLLKEEVERWPGWQDDLDFPPEDDPLSEREEAEWQLADLILAGSEFVVDSLKKLGISEEKCRVVPYGVSLDKFRPVEKTLKDRPLRVLFIGEVGLRKGVPYLLEALKNLNSKNLEARLIGKISINREIVKKYEKYAHFLGFIPRNRIQEHYAWADVFVLPSICEGSATVTYEALASGIPVVCTPNTGSIVRDGIDGHIVPIRNSEEIVKVFENYIKNPEILIMQKINTIEGREKVGLEAYRKRIITEILTINQLYD